jgi:hypothetical protein
MPASSIRDLAIKDDDLAAGTHGRGFWILDDITPLRQLNAEPLAGRHGASGAAAPLRGREQRSELVAGDVAGAAAFLYKPETAIRVRWNMNTDTPLPPDEPAGQNPPEGAIIDYYLGAGASGPVTLEIRDSGGALVRRYASTDPVEPVDAMLAIPAYWVRPPHPLSSLPGMHRFFWDLHYTPLAGGRPGYGMQAIVHDTAPSITSIWAMPGRYTVKLTAGGKSYTQPLTVKMDPRVRTPLAGLQQQFTLSKELYDDIVKTAKALEQIRTMRAQLGPLREKAGPGAVADAIAAFDQKVVALGGAAGGGRGGGRGAVAAGPDTLSSVTGSLTQLMRLLESADVAPATQAVAAAADRRAALAKLMARWNALKGGELADLNARLRQANLPAVTGEAGGR